MRVAQEKMSVLAVALYGSRARGDQTEISDTDLLFVTSDERIHHTHARNLSLSYYPLENLKSRACEGDLFLFHVLNEGEVLYDPYNTFLDLENSFKLKKSYEDEIEKANELAWFIIKNSANLESYPVLPKRIAWCVRTILISMTAEEGAPTFSPEELDQFHAGHNVLNLIKSKDDKNVSHNLIPDLEDFLQSLGMADPNPKAISLEDYQRAFEESDNKLALNLLAVLDEDILWTEYD